MTETLVTSSTAAGILTSFADLGTSSTIETLTSFVQPSEIFYIEKKRKKIVNEHHDLIILFGSTRVMAPPLTVQPSSSAQAKNHRQSPRCHAATRLEIVR